MTSRRTSVCACVGIELRTAGDPAAKHVVLPAARRQSLATFVHVGVDRFGEHQAFVDIVDIDAAAVLIQQRFVVGLEVVAEQRKLKSAAALKRTVAGAAVASQSSQQRNDVLLEIRNFLTSASANRSLSGAAGWATLAVQRSWT